MPVHQDVDENGATFAASSSAVDIIRTYAKVKEIVKE